MGKKNSQPISRKNRFEVYTLDDIMTVSYGAKGTYTRELAEIKIKAIAKNIATLNKLKEKES